MAHMSAALTVQSAALEALQVAGRTSTDLGGDLRKGDVGWNSTSRPGSDAGSVAGSLGGAGVKSSLASFLEFQQTLSQRYDGTQRIEG